MSNTYFDITINGAPAGRFVFKLYDDVVPKTAASFSALCTLQGQRFPLCHSPVCLYRAVNLRQVNADRFDRFMLQGGDFTVDTGTGGKSIYGSKPPNENFSYKHMKPGLLSMANAGPNTSGSQFFITTVVTSHLDGKHVVFGEVLDGMNVVKTIEANPTGRGNKPLKAVVISNCGTI